MRKRYLLFALCGLLFSRSTISQTWDGSSSTDWNTPANWSTNAVPISSGAVSIPNTANKPVLAGNVTVASFTMTAGSAINFNGFTLIVSGNVNISGAILNNSNLATDIALTITSGGGAGGNYFGGNTINDHIIMNVNGTGGMYEGYSIGNTYNGNTTYNINGTGEFHSSYSQKCSYNGDLTVNRTGIGLTGLFDAGFTNISGNFSYANNVGGPSYINDGNILSGFIGGTVNITATGAGSPLFHLKGIKNLTTGGTISVQNSGNVDLENDTLTLTSLTVTGFTGSANDAIEKCVITGNLTFAEAAANTGAVYVWANIFNGNTTLSTNAAIAWYEGYSIGNTYNGNAIYNINGTGEFHSSYSQKCSYNGNLTVNRTGIGLTGLFDAGFTNISGNFSYINNAGGSSYLNDGNILSGFIGGTVNISATGAGSPLFHLKGIKNLTTGGTIHVQNSGNVDLENDTLTLAALTVNGFTGSGNDGIYKSVITGNLTFAEAASNTGAVYVWANIINGNTTLTTNAVNNWYEGYSIGNTYNGNTIYNINGTGEFHSSYSQKCSYNGDLTINRTGIGLSGLFDAGFANISGNFSYTNNAGGPSYLNDGNVLSGVIGGTVNISATGAGVPLFHMKGIKNLTTGGTISVQKSGNIEIHNDTLTVAAFNVNSFTSAGNDGFTKNMITGHVSFSDSSTNAGAVYVGENIITGNTVFTSNAPITWYESYAGSDRFNGNVSFTRNTATGILYIAYSDTTYANKDLVLNSTAGININTTVEFGGSNNAIIDQLGTQPITMPRLIMNKTGGGRITLNDSVTVTTGASFTSGNIYSSLNKELVFPNNVTSHIGTSATSHVIGPVIKVGDDVFTFPVGGPVSYNPVTMSAPAGVTSRFKAEYKMQNPSIDGYNTSLKAGSFGAAQISNAGYWDVQRLSGVTNVTLTLGFNANPYELYPVLANLKVAHWNGAQWDDHGNGGTTGTAASGTVINSTAITSFSPFTIAGVVPTYFFVGGQPGPGPDGSPIKLKGIGGWPGYTVKQLPGGSYTADSIFLVPNGSTTSFRLKDLYGVEKDTSITAPATPASYASANSNGTVSFEGWRHFVYMRNGSGHMIGAIRDNDLTLGNTTMNVYFSTANVATAPNGNIFLKRSFKITSQFAPIGNKRVRFYISKTEFTNLQAADPTSFPSGLNSLTITKYTGAMEDSLFNPVPGGNAVVIPNSDITIADLGTMYSLDIDVSGFSGFYIGGNNANVNLCTGSTITVPSNITGTTYQWQADNGSGYTNISNSAVYGGTTTRSLTLTNTPSNLYGYKFRCVVNGSLFSQVYTVKFTGEWLGTAGTAWENTANWSCGVLPDANTDVILNAGKPNFPQLNSNRSIRTLKANPGATITIKTGFNLTILK